MKKIILLVYILFIIVPFYAQSIYEENVILPVYDANNSEMFLISSDADWSHINDTDKKYFFVIPGDYSHIGNTDYTGLYGRIVITASGTATDKRYIILHNGNNMHPGKLNYNQLAKVGFVFQDANYWVIDRMSYWESATVLNPIQIKNSDHNIINRYFMHNVGNGIYIYPGSDNTTIQNCRIERDDISIYHDRAGIGLFNNAQDNISIKNTKVVNNEVRNFVDGIQTIRQNFNTIANNNFEGTIIDHNHFYIDNTVYTDCNGNHDPNGNCAYAENGMDFKVGSENPDNPMIISNNIMWGFKQSDATNSDLGGSSGGAISIHYNVNHTIMSNNIAFNANIGVSIAGPTNGYAMRNSKIEHNIFYNITNTPFYIADSDRIEINHNLYKDTASEANYYWLSCYDNTNMQFSNNLTVNAHNKTVRFRGAIEDYTASNNTYYQAIADQIADDSDIFLTNDPTINYNDLTFTTDRYTNTPRIMTVPRIIEPNCDGANISNISVTNISSNSATITWEGNPNATTWLYVHELDTTGTHHPATGNSYTYPSLGANYTFTVFVQGENNCEEPMTVEFSTSNLTVESPRFNNINIYPNPATNFLTIKNQQDFKNYIIINMVGQKIASGILKEEPINIDTLEKGIYFIELSNEEKSMMKQFIKN